MEASTTQRWRALMQILVAILTLGVDMYPTRRNTTEAAITFRGMVDVPKRFPDSGDDRGTGDFQPFNRTSLNRESRRRPTKDSLANITPLRF